MTMCEHVLDGCAPIPLASYLKGLGILRLVAEQIDPNASGFWRNERFVLRTRFTEDELVEFFLREYAPTPLISPWNGGSGFYFREGKGKEKDHATGKRIKSGVRDEATVATRTLDGLLKSPGKRFEKYRRAVGAAREILAARKLEAAPEDIAKAELIRELRSALPDEALNWIDAAAVTTVRASETVRQLDIAFPPLLGSGGNDGNLDFSTALLQTLFSLIDPASGEPVAEAPARLRSALFGEITLTGKSPAVSQFAPGAVSSPNSGVGFSGTSTGNGWDIVFGLEGTLVFSTAIARRIGTIEGGGASFPFMISRSGTFGAGAGNIDATDEHTARGEFWAPIWERPVEYYELLSLFREGRAVIERKIVGTALDFARSLGQLGVDRGVSHFERYAFEQRFGNMYLGVPLSRRKVERNPNADLISDLGRGGWLDRVRGRLRGKNVAASLIFLGHRLDEALFRLAGDNAIEAVQEALIAFGALMLEVGRRPKLRQSDKGAPAVPPPPRLSRDWIVAADDGSHEFALAAALASLDAITEGGFRLPFRRHLGPLGWPNGREAWVDSSEAQVLAVWSGRDLLRDMAAVCERRLIEAQRRAFIHSSGSEQQASPELPLRGRRTASLASVAAFLAGSTDDARIAALAAGLAWARAAGPASATVPAREHPLPFAYAALKPLFEPSGVGTDPEERRLKDPLPLIRLLRAGRIDDVVSFAQRLARGADLPAPFARRDPGSATGAARLVAALLFPIAPMAQQRLLDRAYPNLTRTGEETDAA
jgi:CRISPR-associated protein Csx17